jgi:hypothetical protein
MTSVAKYVDIACSILRVDAGAPSGATSDFLFVFV